MKHLSQPDEYQRLRALRKLDLTDSVGCPFCDALVALAATYFNVPMVMISLVGRDEQILFAQHGMPFTGSARSDALCNIVVDAGEAQIIPDTRVDPRTANNMFVTGQTSIRFYAGHPIRSSDGHVIGTFCLLDHETRALNEVDKRDFGRFGTIAGEMIVALARDRAFKRTEADLLAKTRQLTRANSAMAQVGRIAKIGTWEVNPETMDVTWSDEIYRIHEVDVIDKKSVDLAVNYYADYDRDRVNAAVHDAIVDGTPFDLTADLLTAKGNLRHVRSAGERDVSSSAGERIIGIFQDVTDAVDAKSRLSTATL